jgi:hypothetical protein
MLVIILTLSMTGANFGAITLDGSPAHVFITLFTFGFALTNFSPIFVSSPLCMCLYWPVKNATDQ